VRLAALVEMRQFFHSVSTRAAGPFCEP